MIERVGPNAYVLDLPSDLGISSTFNITDLVSIGNRQRYLVRPLDLFLFIVSDPNPECPLTNWPERGERIERILDDQAITTRGRDYQCFLIRWQGQPESDDS